MSRRRTPEVITTLGVVGSIALEMVLQGLVPSRAAAAHNLEGKFKSALLPEQKQGQLYIPEDDAPQSELTSGDQPIEGEHPAERVLGRLVGYVQQIDLGDGRVTVNYYDLDGELVSRDELEDLIEDNVFQIVPLGAPVRVGNVTFLPPDDGEWRLVPKDNGTAVAQSPETAASVEVVSSGVVAYVNDQELGRGDGAVSAMFYHPDGRLMTTAEAEALLEQGDFIVRPVTAGTTFTDGEPLPVGEVWYEVELQPRRGAGAGKALHREVNPGEPVAVAMAMDSDAPEKQPPDGGGGGGGEGDPQSQEGDTPEASNQGGDEPLEVAYIIERAEDPQLIHWTSLIPADRQALAAYFQLMGRTDLMGETIQPGALTSDVAQWVRIPNDDGVKVIRYQSGPAAAFEFFGLADDEIIPLRTESDLDAYIGTAEPAAPGMWERYGVPEEVYMDVLFDYPRDILERLTLPEGDPNRMTYSAEYGAVVDAEGRAWFPDIAPAGSPESESFVTLMDTFVDTENNITYNLFMNPEAYSDRRTGQVNASDAQWSEMFQTNIRQVDVEQLSQWGDTGITINVVLMANWDFGMRLEVPHIIGDPTGELAFGLEQNGTAFTLKVFVGGGEPDNYDRHGKLTTAIISAGLELISQSSPDRPFSSASDYRNGVYQQGAWSPGVEEILDDLKYDSSGASSPAVNYGQ